MINRIIYALLVVVILFSSWSCTTGTPKAIETFHSDYSFDETVSRLQNALETENIRIFSIIDHSNEAQKADLELRPTIVLIVGNPKAGTALMQENQQSAIELPLKILIAENENGEVTVSYKKSTSLARDYNLEKTAENTKIIDKKMTAVITSAIGY